MAEREGFEPPDGCPSTVFKTAAFDHSATSPRLAGIVRRQGTMRKGCGASSGTRVRAKGRNRVVELLSDREDSSVF